MKKKKEDTYLFAIRKFLTTKTVEDDVFPIVTRIDVANRFNINVGVASIMLQKLVKEGTLMETSCFAASKGQLKYFTALEKMSR